jgi:hypothetical protein
MERKEPHPARVFWNTFKEGEKVLLCGKEVEIIRLDDDSYFDDENFLPELRIGYWDKNEVFQIKTLGPRDVHIMLKHKE